MPFTRLAAMDMPMSDLQMRMPRAFFVNNDDSRLDARAGARADEMVFGKISRDLA